MRPSIRADLSGLALLALIPQVMNRTMMWIRVIGGARANRQTDRRTDDGQTCGQARSVMRLIRTLNNKKYWWTKTWCRHNLREPAQNSQTDRRTSKIRNAAHLEVKKLKTCCAFCAFQVLHKMLVYCTVAETRLTDRRTHSRTGKIRNAACQIYQT